MLYDKKWETPEVKDKFGFDENGYSGRPSTLIRTGISCLKQRLLIDEGFKPEWTDGRTCFAGSVWYHRDKENPYDYQGNVRALSPFGNGHCIGGFRKLGLEMPDTIPNIFEVGPMENTDTFIAGMTKMADMFEREGF